MIDGSIRLGCMFSVMNESKDPGSPTLRSFGLFFICLAAILSLLFAGSFVPAQVHFNNDGPLGMLHADWLKLPQGFRACWYDINWLGFNEKQTLVMPSNILRMVLGPVGYSKFYPPIVLLFFGCCAWVCFRSFGFSGRVCAVGGIAAALGMNYFSLACYGIGTQTMAFGFDFLALAAVASASGGRYRWIKLVLAGMAVGMGVMEGVDNGAIFSIFVAAFVAFCALRQPGPLLNRLVQAGAQLAVVAVFAGLLAAQALDVLIGTQIKGVAGMEQDAATKAHRWDEATQWSLPKREALSLIVPGLFGYGMNTPEGGTYWGAIGRDPAWDRYFAAGAQGTPPMGTIRRSGTGIYAGVAVALVGLWAVVQSWRKQNSVFTLPERKFIWFWSGAALVALLLAFGRFAPFYQLIYALPYASTFRNPGKFGSVFNWALLILFATGLSGLSRRYLNPAQPKREGAQPGKSWWARAERFDRRWVIGCVLAFAASLVGWFVYSSNSADLVRYLLEVPVQGADPKQVAAFSAAEVGWFVLFLALAVALVTLILSGAFSGRRARWATVALGLLIVVDLSRANLPWIVYWDYPQKYASNQVIDRLRDKPYEQRVILLPPWLAQLFQVPEQVAAPQQTLAVLYQIEWSQQIFPYYNIQSLDVIQLPRPPVEYVKFEDALRFRGTKETLPLIARHWELTNTRYLLGLADFLPLLNQGLDQGRQRFRIAARFDIGLKPGVAQYTTLEELTAVTNATGKFALFDFTGALPRAKLYSNWEINTNDDATLAKLASPSFDPAQTVLVAGSVPEKPAAGNQNSGTVAIVSYEPTRLSLHAKAQAPSVLLLNDHFDPLWQVSVDGKPAVLLRCNYVMQGVQVPAGDHEIALRFVPPVNSMLVSLGAIILGLGLLGFVSLAGVREARAAEPSVPLPAAKGKSESSDRPADPVANARSNRPEKSQAR